MVPLSLFFKKLGEKEIVVTAGDVNSPVGSNPEYYEDQRGGYGYEVKNKEGGRILEFCAAKNMTVGNSIFKKKVSDLVTQESGPSKTRVDYFFGKEKP